MQTRTDYSQIEIARKDYKYVILPEAILHSNNPFIANEIKKANEKKSEAVEERKIGTEIVLKKDARISPEVSLMIDLSRRLQIQHQMLPDNLRAPLTKIRAALENCKKAAKNETEKEAKVEAAKKALKEFYTAFEKESLSLQKLKLDIDQLETVEQALEALRELTKGLYKHLFSSAVSSTIEEKELEAQIDHLVDHFSQGPSGWVAGAALSYNTESGLYSVLHPRTSTDPHTTDIYIDNDGKIYLKVKQAQFCVQIKKFDSLLTLDKAPVASIGPAEVLFELGPEGFKLIYLPTDSELLFHLYMGNKEEIAGILSKEYRGKLAIISGEDEFNFAHNINDHEIVESIEAICSQLNTFCSSNVNNNPEIFKLILPLTQILAINFSEDSDDTVLLKQRSLFDLLKGIESVLPLTSEFWNNNSDLRDDLCKLLSNLIYGREEFYQEIKYHFNEYLELLQHAWNIPKVVEEKEPQKTMTVGESGHGFLRPPSPSAATTASSPSSSDRSLSSSDSQDSIGSSPSPSLPSRGISPNKSSSGQGSS